MTWFLVAILAYLIFAIVFLIDKYFLIGPVPNPKVYTFYTGVFRVLALLLIPFTDFRLPEISQIILSFSAGGAFVYALFWFFKALQLYEPSRIVPAIGGIVPISSFLLVFIFSGGKEVLGFWEFLALILLISGTILITYEKSKRISLKSLEHSVVAGFFFALSFVLAKYVYLAQGFLPGFILVSVGGFLTALIFLLTREVREGLFKKKIIIQKKTMAIFVSNQTMGAGANILQNFAIALAPLAYVAIINALQGVQYMFLLIFVIFLSLKFPKILKEEISKRVIFQKIVAILLIGGGLVLLSFK